MEEVRPSLNIKVLMHLYRRSNLRKRKKLNLVEIDIETPTVVDNITIMSIKLKAKEINDEIDLRVVKKRKSTKPRKFKQILDEKKKVYEGVSSKKVSGCHFCFNNPKVASHMLISIAENSYITF